MICRFTLAVFKHAGEAIASSTLTQCDSECGVRLQLPPRAALKAKLLEHRVLHPNEFPVGTVLVTPQLARPLGAFLVQCAAVFCEYPGSCFSPGYIWPGCPWR
jgi:hypothetical protein